MCNKYDLLPTGNSITNKTQITHLVYESTLPNAHPRKSTALVVRSAIAQK